MKIEIIIKKAERKDLKKIAELMLKEFSKPPFNEKRTLKNVIKSINFYFNNANIYLANINKIIIGVIVFKIEQYWEGKVVIIEDLAVDNRLKNKGVGKALINYIENYAKKDKIKSILFYTNKKSKSIGFYDRLGYKIDKNRICMRKNLR